jgi:hypothetical protein
MVDEWLEINVEPKVKQMEEIVENCKKQIALGGWIQDYKEATEPMEESSQ